MKAITGFLLTISLMVLINANLSQTIIKKDTKPLVQNKENTIKLLDDDCYTYERVFINDQWWIYVYDCEGVLINAYLEYED